MRTAVQLALKPHLRKCVCGAQPRYGYDLHVARCPMAQEAVKPKDGEALPDVPKGHCPRCAKHIGRGLHFHMRSCRGDPG